ncbi:hypothetical protein TIFTF001_021874 [Ficus carica]|uniref:Uncharacterized protein n=1 Tax=Ficus carica TaxID=3494 RepID=A0AA88DF04_FICCA|nr:hypothetical protein TIFTF001_021874 [Ficus carica]
MHMLWSLQSSLGKSSRQRWRSFMKLLRPLPPPHRQRSEKHTSSRDWDQAREPQLAGDRDCDQ